MHKVWHHWFSTGVAHLILVLHWRGSPHTYQVELNAFASAMLPLLSLTVILVSPRQPFWTRSVFSFTSHQLQQYADDTQLRIGCSVNDEASAMSTLESCLASVHSSFCHSCPALNPSKLEAIIFGTRQRLNSFPRPSVIDILSSSVPISDYITTLGVTLDSNLTLNKHVSSVCKSPYCSIKTLCHIRPVLTCDLARTAAASLTQTHLDFNNSVLIGTSGSNINKRVQTCLAGVVLPR